MRDYGTISPQFWIGKTGKSLRGKPEAQLVALYLQTSPHAAAIGIFHCPIVYICHETGLPFEGASKGLRSLIEEGFCQYDEETEEVFVVNMARYQVAESLEPKDKRCVWIARELEKVSSDVLRSGFVAIYSIAFHLANEPVDNSPKPRGFDAPSKPLRSQEQEQEQDREQEQERERDIPRESQSGPPASPAAQPQASQKSEQPGSRIPENWALSESGRAFCAKEKPGLDPDALAAAFLDHWRAVPGKDGIKTNWEGVWRNWVRRERLPAESERPADIARTTVPGTVGRDPVLQKLDEDAKRAVPIPAAVRQQLAGIKTAQAAAA